MAWFGERRGMPLRVVHFTASPGQSASSARLNSLMKIMRCNEAGVGRRMKGRLPILNTRHCSVSEQMSSI